MKYVTITAKPQEPVYFIIDKTDEDHDGVYGINITFYCDTKIILKNVYRWLYNIKEGKFYRNQDDFKVLHVKDNELLGLKELGLDTNKTLYKVSLNIEDSGSFNNCYIIAKRVAKRINKKFAFYPIIDSNNNGAKIITMRLQKYFK